MGMNIDASRLARCSLCRGRGGQAERTSANDNDRDDLLAQLMWMATSV
jgi:hypothetical protein